MHEHTDDWLLITKAAMKGIDQIFKKGLSIKGGNRAARNYG
jgi:DNA polymerase V